MERLNRYYHLDGTFIFSKYLPLLYYIMDFPRALVDHRLSLSLSLSREWSEKICISIIKRDFTETDPAFRSIPKHFPFRARLPVTLETNSHYCHFNSKTLPFIFPSLSSNSDTIKLLINIPFLYIYIFFSMFFSMFSTSKLIVSFLFFFLFWRITLTSSSSANTQADFFHSSSLFISKM